MSPEVEPMTSDDSVKKVDPCATEEIHAPSMIQPHGLFFALDPRTFEIVQVSANTERFLSAAPQDVLGKPIAWFLNESAYRALTRAASAPKPQALNPLAVTLRGRSGFHIGLVHRSDGLLILEVEPSLEDVCGDPRAFIQRMHSLTYAMQGTRTIAEAYRETVRLAKQMTGFDRAILYRFVEGWEGQVVAEDKEAGMESFLDFHYPESDIPAQARRLYRESLSRIIPDSSYEPVPIVPAFNPRTGVPTNLTHAVLRSISPMHARYLQNFGSAASMSASVLKDGKLWGLISCSHRTPRFISWDARRACEFLGQLLSFQIGKLDMESLYAEQLSMRAELTLLERALAAGTVWQWFKEYSESILALVHATGVALIKEGHLDVYGDVPPEDDIWRIVTWLRQNNKNSIYATHELPMHFPRAISFCDRASGLLAIAHNPGEDDYLLWFRPEVIKTLKWGGNPHKAMEQDQQGRPSPRRSFALWREEKHLKAQPWSPLEMECANELRLSIIDARQRIALARLHDSLATRAARLTALNEAKDLFLATVTHDLRMPLVAIDGYVSLLHSEEPGSEFFLKALDGIERNAKHEAQLVSDLLDVSRIATGKFELNLEDFDLKELVEETVDGMTIAAEKKCITVEVEAGVATAMVHGDSTRVRQVFQNLLSNALKFTPTGGFVTVRLRRVQTNYEVSVQDNGEGIDPQFLPFVFDRFQQENLDRVRQHGGLGLGLAITKKIAELHHGSVYAESQGRGKGSTFFVVLPSLEASKAAENRTQRTSGDADGAAPH